MRKAITRTGGLFVGGTMIVLAGTGDAQAGIGFLAHTHIGFLIAGLVIGAVALHLYNRSKK